MKNVMTQFSTGFAALSLLSNAAFADTFALQGSDTMAGAVTDAIIQGGLDGSLKYLGGGSGKGEAAIVAKTQGIAPISRKFSDAAKAKASAAGIQLVEHIVALDAVSMFVNGANGIAKLDLETLKKIYACEITAWSAINPGASGNITVYARNDASGTTDTFKALVGIKTFGSCVKVVAETSDIAAKTSTEANAIGYAGLDAKRNQNRIVPLSKDSSSQAFDPSPANVRSFKYPLSRNLYVYEAKGSIAPNAAENELLELLLDPSFMNPILLDHNFITLK